MKRYCKTCGTEVDVQNMNVCPSCGKTTSYNTISEYTIQSRKEQLMAMHALMCNANDETIYMTWIYIMPDEPSEDDFRDIAMDDEQYNEFFDEFVRLIAKNGNRY